jgi:hypothetical protein
VTNEELMVESLRRNLVIVRAGDKSLHPQWLQAGAPRSWDIIINYFGDDAARYRQDDVERIDSKGPKWPALQALILQTPRVMADYDYIWLPDDDLETSQDQINQLFEIMRARQLQVAQPALTWNSFFGHLTTLQNPKFELRYTNYVEVMAPCFSAAVLKRAVPLFNQNLSGWGLDFIWPKLVPQPTRDIAIIDSVTVRHTRPVGGPNYKALLERGLSPWDELRKFCALNDLELEPIIRTFSAVRADGRLIDAASQPRRFTMILLAGYAGAVFKTPQPRQMLRRMAGMVWKAMANLPDRVAELPMRQPFWSRRSARL